MARKKLTEALVERIRAPDPSGRQTLNWDTATPGFGVLASGNRTSPDMMFSATPVPALP